MSQVSDGGTEAREPAFTDLLTPDDSPASDPTQTPDDAPAAVQPEEPEPETRQSAREPDEEDRSPYIPRSRFDEVNTKLKDLKSWREQRAWAEHVDPQTFQTMAEWYGKATANPLDFTLNLLREMAQHPDYSAKVRSDVARLLGTRPSTAQPADASTAEALQPDVEITDANGNVVGRTYSDKTLAKFVDQIRQQTLAEVDSRYADKFSTLEKLQQRETATETQRQAETMAATFLTELSSLPLFDEHKKAIAEYLTQHPSTTDDPAAVQAATYRAYWSVVGPKLQNGSRNESAVLADFQRKARASSGVNPGTASSASPKAVSSFYDKTLQW